MFNTQSDLSQLLHRFKSLCMRYCTGIPLSYNMVNYLGKKIVKTSFLNCFSLSENQDAEPSSILHKLVLLL